MKRIVTALVIALNLALASAALGADGPKLGSVDIQKILLSSDAGKEAKEQLSATANRYEKEINSRKEELNRLKAELEKQNVLLSESARGAKEKDYQQKLKEFQRLQKDAQDDMETKNAELTNKIGDEIFKMAQEYGRKNGYTYIFIKSNLLLYVDDKADLTDEMLKAFNATRKK